MNTTSIAVQGNLASGSAYDSAVYRHMVLLMLLLVYMFNFVDRQLLVILQEAIKRDMGFSDTQLGLMSGFAFALLYVSFGIPIARWADRGNRRNIIALSLGIWSLMTAVCGMAQNFVQMLLARMGVAVGEAGGTPPALSMISDMYPEEKRATAMAVYTSGMYIGLLAGFVLGGWIGQTWGWRVAFIAIGLPGVIFALLLRLLVREPMRAANTGAPVEQESIADTIRFLCSSRTFVFIALAGGMTAFASYGVGNWFPSYMLRRFELSIAEVGLWMGLAAGFGGVVGTIGGGVLVDALVTRDRRWYTWLPMLTVSAGVGLSLTALTMDQPYLAIALGAVAGVFNSAWLPSVLALSHSLVGIDKRAQATAILFLVMNLIGMGLGPSMVGLLSDWFGMPEGGASLRLAMAGVGLFGVSAAGFCFYQASRSLQRDVDNVHLATQE